MRVLLFSYRYAPGVGGMETIAAGLVRQWLRDGHDVTVITHQVGEPDESQSPRALRCRTRSSQQSSRCGQRRF
jgi:hypothetical protein